MLEDPRTMNCQTTLAYRNAVLDIGDQWVKKRQKSDIWKLGTVDLFGAIMKAGEPGGKSRYFTSVEFDL